MKIHYGKQVGGKIFWYPRIMFWAGFLFLFLGRHSVMIPLPNWLIKESAIWGIDLIGD